MGYLDNEDLQNNGNQITQFLSFSLGEEDYGVDILRVQEIRGWEEVRDIPNTPDYIKGVLNLRSSVVPIIDLRIRFGLQDVEYKATTVIIVLSVEAGDKQSVVGVVVDAVSDVLDVNQNSIKVAPDFGSRVNTKYINGMTMIDERMVVLLDTDKLLDPEEMSALANITE
jgi:purine-binding chemotaxis protein CheW